jgi:hypothetical protein
MPKLKTILKGLEKIKKGAPAITCSAYRREVESVIKKENRKFAKEDKSLAMKNDALHRNFSFAINLHLRDICVRYGPKAANKEIKRCRLTKIIRPFTRKSQALDWNRFIWLDQANKDNK